MTILQFGCTILQNFRRVVESPRQPDLGCGNHERCNETRRIPRQANREELAELISQALPEDDGTVELQPGMHFRKHSSRGKRVYGSYPPAFCVVAQGSKDIFLGDETFHYDAMRYLISTMELPLSGEVVEVSAKRPYLNFRMVLDPSVVTSVMIDTGYVQPKNNGAVKAVDVSPLDNELLDATVRLVRLLDSPNEYRLLAPLVVREIIYRLLTGEQASRLCHVAKLGGQAHRMARAIATIRKAFHETFRIEDLAGELDMSVSGFHSHFKAVTGMSPLQFQKQLRLQEARRLMLNDNVDATQAGLQVGYDDASHFNREYKRMFGNPPKRDVEHLRELSHGK